MALENVRRFDARVAKVDEVEAYVVNEAFDRHRALGAGEKALELAARETETQLADPLNPLFFQNKELYQPNAELVGFDKAKKAKRWWNYRQAHLNDLEPVYKSLDRDMHGDPSKFGLEMAYANYAHKFMALTEVQADMGSLIIAGDPFYTGLCAALETKRRETAPPKMLPGNEVWHNDPIKLEVDYALKGLLNAFDEAADGPDATRSIIGDIQRGEIRRGDLSFRYSLIRRQYDSYTGYTFLQYDPRDDKDAEGHHRPVLTYKFREDEKGISCMGTSPLGPEILDTRSIGDLARDISHTQAFTFARPGEY